MRKHLLPVFRFAALACIVGTGAFPLAAEDVKIGELLYAVDQESKTATVAAQPQEFKETVTSLVIPSTVEYEGVEYSVAAIGESAFTYCAGLTDVTLPEHLKYVEKWGFYGCTGLTSVVFPAETDSIGPSAFMSCSGLT